MGAKKKIGRERFQQLTMEHLPLLRRLALRKVRSEALADDLVQETCLRAWKYRASLDPEGNVRAWLCRILGNEAAREMGRGRISEADLDVSELDAVPEAARVYQDELPDTELVAALETLPADFAGALVLHSVEGFTYQEIADAQGVPIGTVMSRLHRARQMMRRALTGGESRQFEAQSRTEKLRVVK